MVVALDREGFQVHMHAIGDRAIRMALDAVEAARTANGVRDSRHHIAHLQLIDPADIPRFRRLGVIANFQPLWAQADPYILNLTQPLIGPKRSRWLYPIASVARTGVPMVFGSDWPVTSMNPLEILQVAITRRDPSAGPGPGVDPRGAVDLAACLAAYTIAGAYLDFRERETGSIETGKAADLVVLDRNLFEVPPDEIARAKVGMTLLEGRVRVRARRRRSLGALTGGIVPSRTHSGSIRVSEWHAGCLLPGERSTIREFEKRVTDRDDRSVHELHSYRCRALRAASVLARAGRPVRGRSTTPRQGHRPEVAVALARAMAERRAAVDS